MLKIELKTIYHGLKILTLYMQCLPQFNLGCVHFKCGIVQLFDFSCVFVVGQNISPE